MSSRYTKTMKSIEASDNFKRNTLQYLEEKDRESEKEIFMMKKVLVGLAACLVLAMGIVGFNVTQGPATIDVADVNLYDRMVIDPDASGINACVMVNIEGTIVEVGKDGLSFKLDNGKWVKLTNETEYGTTLPTSLAIEDQLLEPTFRVGNMIAGFSENPDTDEVIAYAIYTNWNWDDPIRK